MQPDRAKTNERTENTDPDAVAAENESAVQVISNNTPERLGHQPETKDKRTSNIWKQNEYKKPTNVQTTEPPVGGEHRVQRWKKDVPLEKNE